PRRARTCVPSALPSVLPARIAARDVPFHELPEFLGDALALQRHGLLAVLVHRRHRPLPGAGQANADVGVLALAGAVDDAAHDGDRHVLGPHVVAPPGGHALAHVVLDALGELLEIAARRPPAAGAGDDARQEGTEPEALQDLLRDADFLAPVAAGL